MTNYADTYEELAKRIRKGDLKWSFNAQEKCWELKWKNSEVARRDFIKKLKKTA